MRHLLPPGEIAIARTERGFFQIIENRITFRIRGVHDAGVTSEAEAIS
jgi:hypothetical protein